MREQCVTIRCQLNDRDDKDTVNNDDNEDILETLLIFNRAHISDE